MVNVVEMGTRRAATPVSAALMELASLAEDRLSASYRETLVRADDLLFSHAQQALNGMRQAQYFDDMRQLRLGQDAAVAAFRKFCRDLFNGEPAAWSSRPTPSRDDTLELVAEDELEIDLALMRIGQRCDEAAPRIRASARRRAEAALGLHEGAVTPLNGTIIARMCRAGMTTLDLGLESRLIVLKQLERQLATDMEPLLEAVNAALLKHGVLPNLRTQPTLPTKPATAPTSRPLPASAAPTRSAPTTPPNPAAVDTRHDERADLAQLSDTVVRMAQWMAQQDAAVAANAAAQRDDARERARERLRAEIAERRAAELTRAQEARRAAEVSTDRVISEAASLPHLPESMATVMRGPLRRHLEAVHARRGDTSKEWRSACKLVRDIAWAMDPETANVELAHWKAMVPGIVESLRSALIAAGLDDGQIDHIVGEFGQRYEQLLAGQTRSAEEAAESPTSQPVPAAAETEAEAEAAPAAVATPVAELPRAPKFSEALQQVRSLTLGRWFELIDDHGQPQRVKLVWTSSMTERCLFVNPHGKLVADRPHVRVANDLIAGHFREIDPP